MRLIGHSAVHYACVFMGLDRPQTQTTLAEREVLSSLLPGAKRIVEIGVFEGFTTRMLAEKSDADAVVYGIDPFFVGRLGISWCRRTALSYNRRHVASGKVKFISKLSTDAGSDIPDSVEYIFVDGDHSLAGIKADWKFWSERLASGGIIALHDTLLTLEKPVGYSLGSIEYFRDHIQHDPRFETLAQQDSLSVLKKR